MTSNLFVARIELQFLKATQNYVVIIIKLIRSDRFVVVCYLVVGEGRTYSLKPYLNAINRKSFFPLN